MKKNDEKILMSEAAILYYEKKYTQQEVADIMKLSRQTVSKLLGDAIRENLVEIKIHDPKKDCFELEELICQRFGIKKSVVCSVSNKNEVLRRHMTVRAAADYILPIFDMGNLNIALSWGRTVEEFINTLPDISTSDNTVFPLFGATENENSYFASNELARGLADKIGANVKYAYFPYMTDTREDCVLLKKLSYYQKMKERWQSADIAIVGIGNTEMLDVFGKTFGYSEKHLQITGDIATHFFNEKGEIIELYENTICASAEDLKNAGEIIAIAGGNDKINAIRSALRTGIIDTLITDEYTAAMILK